MSLVAPFPSRRLRPALATAAAALLVLTGCSAQNDGEDSAEQSQSQDGASAEGGQGGDAAASSSPSASEEPKELYGGGEQIFPDRRMVALYGSPMTPGLGVLGEQDPEASVQRVQELAEQYQPFSEEPVQPAFEIIATTASSSPGEDGDYSQEMSPEELMPLIEAAEENEVYVILDLQPGSADFEDQARMYEDLLKRPNVGIGLDPEWKLLPGQVPLQQIGSVDAEEINRTLDYVAELTEEEELPQKLVVLHQFTHTMIQNREMIDTSHEQLALTLHADGHGTPELKQETYTALQEGLPEDIRMSWKNFYDEDTPTLTPEQTYQQDPKPWVVTYQ